MSDEFDFIIVQAKHPCGQCRYESSGQGYWSVYDPDGEVCCDRRGHPDAPDCKAGTINNDPNCYCPCSELGIFDPDLACPEINFPTIEGGEYITFVVECDPNPYDPNGCNGTCTYRSANGLWVIDHDDCASHGDNNCLCPDITPCPGIEDGIIWTCRCSDSFASDCDPCDQGGGGGGGGGSNCHCNEKPTGPPAPPSGVGTTVPGLCKNAGVTCPGECVWEYAGGNHWFLLSDDCYDPTTPGVPGNPNPSTLPCCEETCINRDCPYEWRCPLIPDGPLNDADCNAPGGEWVLIANDCEGFGICKCLPPPLPAPGEKDHGEAGQGVCDKIQYG